jgi:hypothetical protein
MAKAILSKKSNAGDITISILQSNNNKNSMILAQKQTQRPVEQNRKPRHKYTQLQPTDFFLIKAKTLAFYISITTHFY